MNTLQGLNPEQQEAVTHLDGPLLILAGAGSGKTRVLTNRVAWLISEKHIDPWNICAITFTNKAAGEMRERVDALVGFGAEAVHVATFHSTCVRILRRFIDRIGYTTSFDIYDSDDSKTLMKEVLKALDVNTKLYKERAFLTQISHAKDELIDPESFAKQASGDQLEELTAKVYAEYQKRLHRANALDFDDLIVLTVRLFRENPDVLEYYQERYKYLMVDEYQDTNKAQFVLVSLLAQKYRNLCVVGDDDQSIYKFRGADIGNILNFEKIFPDAKVIRLEQNYRSTQNILDAANAVIANNQGRKEKKLWTQEAGGDLVTFKSFPTAQEEAAYIIDDIIRMKRTGQYDYKDSAILYRTNAQSRGLEEQLICQNVPYVIIGGINFYSRREIKDVLAYLKTIDNGADDIAVKRIINVPKRGIGQTSIARIETWADQHDMTFFDACTQADKIPGVGRGGAKVRTFADFILELRHEAEGMRPQELLERIVTETEYDQMLKAEGTEEALERLNNIGELAGKAADYEDLRTFLEEVALVADIDSYSGEDDRVLLMTLHSAKGLEFDNVYLEGMEDGIFPGYRAVSAEDSSELEEERRLCYVGITRAKKRLTLTSASTRMLYGELQWNKVSRFVEEIPQELLAVDEKTKTNVKSGAFGRSTGGNGGLTQRQLRHKKELEEFGKKPFYMAASPAGKGGVKKAAAGVSKGNLGYGVGDTVKHVKFGVGVVKEIRDGGRDSEVTVEFESYGVKKMFAGFARLEKC